MNAASLTSHGAVTPELDTVPSEHILLVVVFHPFIRLADGLLGGLVEKHLVLAFSKGQPSQRVRKQGKVTRFPAA